MDFEAYLKQDIEVIRSQLTEDLFETKNSEGLTFREYLRKNPSKISIDFIKVVFEKIKNNPFYESDKNHKLTIDLSKYNNNPEVQMYVLSFVERDEEIEKYYQQLIRDQNEKLSKLPDVENQPVSLWQRIASWWQNQWPTWYPPSN